MDRPNLEIGTAARGASSRGPLDPRRRRRRKDAERAVACVGLALGAAIAVGLALRGGRVDAPPAPVASDQAAAGPQPARPSAVESSPTTTGDPRETLIDDDGATLWASPTDGPPLSLAYVPSGTQLLIHVRPRELRRHPEGTRLEAAWGTWGADAARALQQAAGSPLEELESALVAGVVDADERLAWTCRATLAEERGPVDWEARLPPGPQISATPPARLAAGRAWILPEGPSGRTVVCCPEEFAAELLAAGDQGPALTPDMQRLAESIDADRTLAVVVAPGMLRAGGTALWDARGRSLRDAALWLWGPETACAAVSADLRDNLFLEIRAATRPADPPQRSAQRMLARLHEAPARLAEAMEQQPAADYGREVRNRFPAMMQAAARHARRGVEDRQAVVRCYLPAVAAHNLCLATRLMVGPPTGDVATAPPADLPSAAAEPSVAARLERVCSLAFPRETLQKALELLAQELGIPIEIVGGDLQLEGITQNQSFGLEQRDRPGGEILLEILRQANPDRTAAGPADPRQQLVYVVRAAAGGGPPTRIAVTTRKAAAERGEPLPAVFSVPAP